MKLNYGSLVVVLVGLGLFVYRFGGAIAWTRWQIAGAAMRAAEAARETLRRKLAAFDVRSALQASERLHRQLIQRIARGGSHV